MPAGVGLGDFASANWDSVLSGVDIVVHLAGRAHVAPGPAAGSLTPYVVANVHVTRRLAEAAARRGVRRVVFASSVKVCGETTRPGLGFGKRMIQRRRSAYAQQGEAENVLRAVCGERGRARDPAPAVDLRSGVRGNFLALLEAIAAQRRLPLAGVANRRSLLYLGNAVSALQTALVSPALAGHALPVADAMPYRPPSLSRGLRARCGSSLALSRSVALLRAASPLIGRGVEMARLLGSLEVDATLFRELTGWTPPYSLDQGLDATAQWWRMRDAL
jgi:nucleoside-diphosphate-sugar epimerase